MKNLHVYQEIHIKLKVMPYRPVILNQFLNPGTRFYKSQDFFLSGDTFLCFQNTQYSIRATVVHIFALEYKIVT